MLGRTHFFVGITAALAIMQPHSVPVIIAGTGAAAVGSVISDIDSGTSQAHKDADKIIAVSAICVAAIVVLESCFHLGIYQKLLANSNIVRIIAGTAAFLLICFFGMQQPHRSFMHSILALVALGACIGTIFPDIVPYFEIAFASHLAIDVFNFRREKLLWPMKKGFCLKLCSSNGIVNQVLMLSSIAASAIIVLLLLGVLHV